MPEFQISNNKLLSLFVDRLMADKGAGALGLDEQRALKTKLMRKLDRDIQEAMLDALPDERLEELDRRLDEGMTDEELELFFEYNSPEVEMKLIITRTLERFREDYLTTGAEGEAETEALEAMMVPGVLIGDLEGGF